MKFFAIFTLAAIFAVAAAIPYEYDSEYEYQGADLEAEASEQLIREERSYGGAKCGKAVLVACGPVIKKVKCKGGY